MRIFTRYVALRFLGPLGFGLGLFALLVFLGDLFEKMHLLVNSQASLYVIAEYLALQIPYWAIRVIPMATLLATLFTVTGFIRSGEYVAIQASGFPSGYFFRPLLFLSLVITALSFTFQEMFLPVCHSRAQTLWREKIYPQWQWNKFRNAVLVVSPERFVTTEVLVVKTGVMDKPLMDDYGPSGILRQISASRASWDSTRRVWVFENGIERTFESRGTVAQERHFRILESDLRVPPNELAPRSKNPDEMNIQETQQYLNRVGMMGGSLHPARTALQSKIAYPFTNFILCALGIPIALRLRRAGRGVSFGVALIVSFVYLWFIETCRALGSAGRWPPFAAAWIPNGIFGIVAAWLYGRTKN